ncbi:DUF814-domain-containing protein [Aureobasidium sp. EXF-10727]|nr:DUF814-domain-containing protein [Aureobasidium sp. EXF-10727]
MVYYFTSNVTSPAAYIYMGKDKVENEDLIAYGFEEDVWFHVDNLSSAHVYVRLPDGESWEDIPKPLLEDCAQLTKANSIEGEDRMRKRYKRNGTETASAGNKKDNITIIYTPWSNLKKDGSMATGQVGFKDQKKVKRVYVAKRENPIVNRLNKTKVEKFPDFRQEKEDRAKELRKKDRSVIAAKAKEEARIARERKELAYQRDHAYDDWNSEEQVMASSNQNRDSDWEDDFM